MNTGESIELIDGENWRIHDLEIQIMLKNFIDQFKSQVKGQKTQFFILTQIGKQSVGKSFLYNHIFKTKFMNRAGRCTSGINFAIRNFDKSRNERLPMGNNDRLIILDTEGIGSLDSGNRMMSNRLNFDRVMVLFCLLISNAVIITLKTEIDDATKELLSICCDALMKIKIDKSNPPTIFFVLNQQTDTNLSNYTADLNRCIDSILKSDLYNSEEIKKYVTISRDNFVVLPNAFNRETRNYSKIFDFKVERFTINSSFNEKCQDVGLKLASILKKQEQSSYIQFDEVMQTAGNCLRTVVLLPDMLQIGEVKKIKADRELNKMVLQLTNDQTQILIKYQEITAKILKDLKNLPIEEIQFTP